MEDLIESISDKAYKARSYVLILVLMEDTH